MGKEILTFGDTEVERNTFYCHKSPIFLEDVDIEKVTDFYDKEIPKVDSNHTYLAVVSLDSALNKDGNY